MKPLIFPIFLLLLQDAYADTFGSGSNAFNMEFVTVTGLHGNDGYGYGHVGYAYRIGVNEVSRSMIDAYNSVSGGPTLNLADMTVFGGNGATRPATGISWNEAARFVNWLNTSTGHSAAYKFLTSGANDNVALWTNGDAGFDPANPFRNAGAYYFLPSEDEWYKAAYYDPNKSGDGSGGYWDYATGSDTPPTAVSSGIANGTAVIGQPTSLGPADITMAGGLSPYGTMGQNGNVWEWVESGSARPNDLPGEARTIRGGTWDTSSNFSASSQRFNLIPTMEDSGVGFRVASIPEISSLSVLLLTLMGLPFSRSR